MVKTMKLYMNFSVLVLLLVSCGGDGGSEAPYTPKTFSQEIKISSNAAEQVLTLDKLDAAIESISGTTDWFRAVKDDYWSGSPIVKISVLENLTLADRKCIVKITTTKQDVLVINVTQEAHAAETNTGVDDSHDNVSNQPAYAPLR